jgi:hypothetical protein
MNKIPVGATIAQGYSFAFGQFFTLLKLMWLPLAIMLAVSYFLMPLLMAVMSPGQSPAGGPWFLLPPLYLIFLVLMFAQFVAIAQYALELKTEPGWFTIPLGKPVWRLIGAFLLVLLVMMGAGLLAVLGGALLGGLAGVFGALTKANMNIVIGFVTVIVMLLVYGAFIYGGVRLTFLLTPVVVAESRIGLGRSWKLGAGNFWRMFIVVLVIFLPLVALELVGLRFLPSFPPIQPGAAPEQVRAAMMAWELGLFSRMHDYWYVVYPCFGVIMVLFYGMLIGAQCFAYRVLVPAETEAEAFA